MSPFVRTLIFRTFSSCIKRRYQAADILRISSFIKQEAGKVLIKQEAGKAVISSRQGEQA